MSVKVSSFFGIFHMYKNYQCEIMSFSPSELKGVATCARVNQAPMSKWHLSTI